MNAKEALDRSNQVREQIISESRKTVYKRIERISNSGHKACYYFVSHLFREEVTELIKELRERGYHVSHDGFWFIARPQQITIRWGRKDRP